MADPKPATARDLPGTQTPSHEGQSSPEDEFCEISIEKLLGFSVQWMASNHRLFGRNTITLKGLVAEAHQLREHNQEEFERLRNLILDHHLTAAQLLVSEVRNPLLELFVLFLRDVDYTKSHKPTKEELVSLCCDWKCRAKSRQCPLEASSANSSPVLRATCQCATCQKVNFCRECMCSSCWLPLPLSTDRTIPSPSSTTASASVLRCDEGCGHALHARCAIQGDRVAKGMFTCGTCGRAKSLVPLCRDRLHDAADSRHETALASHVDLATRVTLPQPLQPLQQGRVQAAKEDRSREVDPKVFPPHLQLHHVSAAAEGMTRRQPQGPSPSPASLELRLGVAGNERGSRSAVSVASRAMAAASAVASVCGGSLAGFQFAISNPAQMASLADLAASPLTADSARAMLAVLGRDQALIDAVQAGIAAEMCSAPDLVNMAQAQQRVMEEARAEVERLTRKAEVDAEVARRKREEALRLEGEARKALEDATVTDLHARVAWQNVAVTKENLTTAFRSESERLEGARQEAYARELEKMLERIRSTTARNLSTQPQPPPQFQPMPIPMPIPIPGGRTREQGGEEGRGCAVQPHRPLTLPAVGVRLAPLLNAAAAAAAAAQLPSPMAPSGYLPLLAQHLPTPDFHSPVLAHTPPPLPRGKGAAGSEVGVGTGGSPLVLSSPVSSGVATREGETTPGSRPHHSAKRRKGGGGERGGEGGSVICLMEREGESSAFSSHSHPQDVIGTEGSSAAAGVNATAAAAAAAAAGEVKEAEGAVVAKYFPQHTRYLAGDKYKVHVMAAVGREFPNTNEWRLCLMRKKGKGARLQLPVCGLEFFPLDNLTDPDTVVIALQLAKQTLGLGEGAVVEVCVGYRGPILVAEEQKHGVMHMALIHPLTATGVAHVNTAYTSEGNYINWCQADSLYTIVRDVPQKFSATFPRALKCLDLLMREKMEGWPIGELLSAHLVKQDALG